MSDKAERFDVVVLGAGPGGGAAAAICVKAGLSVAMIEDYGFGGTCPLRGCNPKKALLGPFEARALAEGLRGKGVDALPELSWRDVALFRDSFVDGKAESIRAAYDEIGVTTIFGRGRFLDADHVVVEGGEEAGRTLSFGHAVLAVGRVPRPLDVPGAGLLVSSDDFLRVSRLPRSLVFIGGGYISFEFAHAAVRAGAEVTIAHRSGRVLKGFDPDMAVLAVQAARAAGIEVLLDAPLHSVEQAGQGLHLRVGKNGETLLPCGMAVHGAGRVPALENLGLNLAGVGFTERGVRTGPDLRSPTNPRVFAVGDCRETPYALTPTADADGRAAGRNILSGGHDAPDCRGVPRVCFSLPPMAAVGALEEELAAANIPFEKRERDLSRDFSWKRLGQRFAASKLLLEPGENGAILGAHMIGHGADELANLLALAIRQRVPARDMSEGCWAYPTLGYYPRYMV